MSNLYNIAASHLDETRVYNYKYEALVTVGARSELPVSQVKFTSDVKIIGDENQKFFIQVGGAASVLECGVCPSCHSERTGHTLGLTFSPTQNLVWPGRLCVDKQRFLNKFMF